MKGTLKLYYGDELLDSMPYSETSEREEIIQYWRQLFNQPNFKTEIRDSNNSDNPVIPHE